MMTKYSSVTTALDTAAMIIKHKNDKLRVPEGTLDKIRRQIPKYRATPLEELNEDFSPLFVDFFKQPHIQDGWGK